MVMLAALCWPAANVEAQCAPPTNFTVSNVTETSATLTWTASSSSNVSQYELNRSTVAVTDFNQYPDFWDSQAGIASVNSSIQMNWTDLDPGTTYYCYLRTVCSDNTRSEYVSLTFTTEPGCKKPVVTLPQEYFASDLVYFNWTNPNFSTGNVYNVQIAMGPKETFNLNNPSTYEVYHYDDISQESYLGFNNWGVEPNTDYSLALRVQCSDESWSPWSKVLNKHTACEGVALPYVEDFDSYTQGVSSSQHPGASFEFLTLPECWGFHNLSETSYRKPLAFLTSKSTLVNSGNALLMYSTPETPIYAMLPKFTGANGEPLILSFHYSYMNENLSGTLTVGYIGSWNGSYYDPNSFTELYSCQVTNQMTLSTQTINNLPANARLAFRFTAANENFGVAIDEVVVTPGGICAPVVVDATHPYTDDFESDQCWQLINDTNTNAWYQGAPNNYYVWGSVPNGERKALYISNDNGAQTSYTKDRPSVVYATKLFSLAAGEYAVRYDWYASGENNSDYLRAALVPASVELAASTTPPTGLTATSLPDGWIALDGGMQKSKAPYLNYYTFETDSIIVTESGYYKVAFIWCNDAQNGTNPPAAIDNFVFYKASCPKPYNFTVHNITDTRAVMTFYIYPETGSYTYILDKSEDFDITDSAKYVNTSVRYIPLTGLEANTSYTAAVRANCSGGGNSAWTGPVSFMTMPNCGEHTAIMFSIGDQTDMTAQIPYYGVASATYRHAASWQIFTAEEILNGSTFAGDITGLAWENDRDVSNSFEIYMCHTDKTSFDSATDTIDRSTMTKVYEGSTHFTPDVWSKVMFDTPFTYDGTHNLLVMVNRTQNMSTGTNSEFKYSTTDDYKTIGCYGPQGLTNCHRFKMRNNTRFTMCVNQNECTYMDVPYSENFDAYTASDNNSFMASLPYCWNRLNAGLSDRFLPRIFTSSTPGNNQVQFYATSSSYYGDQIAILPQVDISSHPINTLQITLGARKQSDDQPFDLVVGVMSDPTDSTTFTPVGTISPSSVYNFTDFTVSFIGYTGSGSYIALMAQKPESGDNEGWIDNVRVEISPCAPVVVDATHPYTDDFESDQCWQLVNGTKTNAWALGSAVNHGGSKALYISNDGGETNAQSGYSEGTVYATKLFSLTQGEYAVSYDWRANGDEFDYLRVALAPASVELTASTSSVSGLGKNTLPAGWIALDGGSLLYDSTNWTTFEKEGIEVTEAGDYKVVFVWRSSPYQSYNPPAAVDNFSLSRMSCSRPLNLRVHHITSNSAKAMFQPTWLETNGLVYFIDKTADFDLTDPGNQYVNIYDTAITLTNLLPNTSYTLAIRANCGDVETSEWNIYTFTTLCTPIATLPYTENFDSYSEGIGTTDNNNAPTVYPNGDMPDCWVFLNKSQSASLHPQAFLSTYHSASGNALCLTSHNVTPLFAVLPAFEEDIHNLLLSFSYRHGGNPTMQVGYMTDPSDPNTFVYLRTLTVSSTFTPIEITFESLPADITSAHIAFRFIGGAINQSFYIDNVSVEMVPSCRKAYDAYVTGNTDESVSLGWSAVNGATGYEVAYGPTSTFDVGTGAYQTMTVNSTTATVSGLTANTDYTFAVRSECEDATTGNSQWSDWTTLTATTRKACGAYAVLPYTENFNSYTHGISGTATPAGYPNVDMPSCWTFLNRGESSNAYPIAYLTNTSGYASGKALFLKSAKNKSLFAILPAFNQDLRDLKLSFTYRNEGVSDYNGTLSVGYMSDPADSSTFVEVQSFAQTTTMTPVEVTFNSLPAAAAAARIAFKYTGGTGNGYYLSIDNVTVTNAQCPGIATLPYTEDFDSYTEGISTSVSAPAAYPDVDLPTCWTFTNRSNSASTSPNAFLTSSSPLTVSGKALMLRVEGDWDATPVFAVLPYFYEDIHNLMLTFNYESYGGSSGFSIGYMTDPSDASTYVQIERLENFQEMREVEMTFNTLPADIDHAYIAFRCQSLSSYSGALHYASIDNVRVEPIPACRKAQNLVATAATGTSVTLSWDEVNGTATEYEVAYAPADDFSLAGNSYQTATVTTNPATINGLAENTKYTFAVSVRCGENGWSDWSSVFTTKTGCATLVGLPYTENFDSYTQGISTNIYVPNGYPQVDLPDCWSFVNRSLTLYNNYAVFLTSKSDYVESGNALLLSPYPLKALFSVLPEFEGDIRDLKLTFSYRNTVYEGYTTYDGHLLVGYMTDPYDTNTFVTLQSLDIVTTMTPVEVLFTDVPADVTSARIAFKLNSDNSRCVSIDNLSVVDINACFPVMVDVAHPYTDDFESGDCWQLINDTLTNAWAIGTATQNGGSKALYISNDNGTTNAYTNTLNSMVYAAKPFYLSAGEYAVRYDWKGKGESSYDYLRVALVPASTTLNASTSKLTGFSATSLPTGWIALDDGQKLNQSTVWKTFESSVIVPENGNYYVVFAWRNDNSSGVNPPVAVDNFSIRQTTCPRPLNLTVQNITTNNAVMQFSAAAGYSSYTYILEEAETFDVTHTANYTNTNSLSNLVTNLEPNTTYTIAVRTNCGYEDYSVWSKPFTFTTLCVPFTTLPYTENFDSYGSNTSETTEYLPDCWGRINAGTSRAGLPNIYSNSSYSASGNNSLKFYVASSVSHKDQIAVLPQADPTQHPVSSLQLSFDARCSSPMFKVMVGVLSDPSDATTFVPVDSLVITSTVHANYEIPLSSYIGPEGRIAIKAPKLEGSNNIGYIDNIVVDIIPTCPRPRNVNASNFTATSIDLAWTEWGNASAWIIEYGPAGFTLGNGTTVNVTSNPSTISGLASGTVYDFYVRANCGGGDISDTSDRIQAVTSMVPVDLPYATHFTNSDDIWFLNNGSCTNYWAKGTVDGTGALFVTDNGTTPNYNIGSTSVVFAQKLFTVGTTDTITITFDVMVIGENHYDYLKMFLAPASEQYLASTNVPTSTDYGYNTYSTYAYDFLTNGYVTNPDYHYFLSMLDSTIHVVAKMPNPNANPTSSSTAQLVFAWINDYIDGDQPPAIIKNLTVSDGIVLPCVPPVNVTSTAVTSNSVTLEWTEAGSAASWMIEYGPSGFTPGNGTEVTATTHPFTVTGLSPLTQYDFYIQSQCGSTLSSDMSDVYTVATACGLISSLPFTENFDAYVGSTTTSVNNLPYCWSNHNTGTTYSGYPIIYPSATCAASGNNSMRFYTYSSSAYDDQMAILPAIDVNTYPMNTLQLSFDARALNTNYVFNLVVGVMTDPTNISTFTPVQTLNITSTSYSNFEIPFTSYSDTGSYIAIKAPHPTSGYNYGYVDNIVVNTFTCPRPQNVNSSNPTTNSIVLAWTEMGNATAWEIEYGPTGFIKDSGTVVNAVTNPFTLVGLESGTVYDFYVRANCGGSDYSNYTSVFTACTKCSPITNLPFEENFDSHTGTTSTSANLPYCWSRFNSGSSYAGLPNIYASATYAASGKNTMRFYTFSSSAYDDQMAILPQIDPTLYPVSNLQLSFDARNYSSSYTLTAVVGVISDTSDKSTFVPVDTIVTTSNTYLNYEIPFSQYTGPEGFIAIMAPKPTTSYNSGYIDNIVVDLAPLCVRPTNVIATNITADGADINWIPGGSETGWEIVVVPTGMSIASGTPEPVSTHPYTIGNLSDSTAYDVYVRADCGTGSDYSSWSPVCHFTTIPWCSSPTDVEVSQIAGTSALLTWTEAIFGATGYTVAYTETGQDNWVSHTVTGNSYMLTGLTPETPYTVTITSECDQGTAQAITKTFTTHCLSDVEYQIGQGTTANSYIPSYSLYNYGYSQQIFTAAEMGGPSSITSISFEMSAFAQQRNYKIYLAHTTASNLASGWASTAGAQLVFSSSQTLHTGWNTFDFTTPFAYNGTDNLLLIVRDSTGSYESGNSWYTHSTTDVRARYTYQDSGVYPLEPASSTPGATLTVRNNVIFGGNCDYTVTCIAPNVYVTDATENSITLNWAPGNNESSWELEYSIDQTTWTSEGTISSSSYTINNLASNTLYYIRMRSVCGSDEYSNWTGLSQLTECGAISSLPFTEDFDTYGTGNSSHYMRCWDRIDNASSGYPYITSTHYNGVGSLRFYAANSGIYNIAITPEFDAAIPVNTLKATFMYRALDATDRLIVGVMTSPTDTASFMAVDTVYPADPANTWVEREVQFSGYTGGGHYIAFKNEYTTSDAYAYIDRLTIDLIPDCPRPLHVTSTNATTNSIELTWDQEGAPASWGIEYGLHGFTPGNGTKVTATTNPFTVTGLNHSTGYDFYVTADCGNGDSSATSFVCYASTSCSVIDALPYVENFDSYGTGTGKYPLCWDRINTYTSSNYAYSYINPTHYNGVGSLYFYASSSGTYNIAITPEFAATIPVNTLKATFMYSANNITDRLVVGVMTSPTDTASFVAVDTVYPASNPYTWVEKEVFFNGYTGGGHYIAFKNEYTTTTATAYIDSLAIDLMPTCPRPHHLVVSNATTNNIELGWTETGSASTWEIAYGAHGFDPSGSTASVITANTNPFTVTGLNSTTSYEFYVRATCSSTDASFWSESVEASTTMVPVALPYTADFTDANDSWVLSNGSCINYWAKGTVGGGGALFVTDNGTTPNYNISKTSVVSAQKLFTVGTTDTVTITFDVRVNGESHYDYLKMFLSPATEQYPAFTSAPSGTYYGQSTYPTYAYDFYANSYGTQADYPYILSKRDSTIHVVAKMPNPNATPTSSSTAQLVFAWRNDGTQGTQPPAIITNLTVTCNPVCEPIAVLPYTEDFEGYTESTTAATGVEPTCWELVQEDVTMTAAQMPQLYYRSNYAHSGNYSLRLYYRGIYAMPALADSISLNTLKLEMYVRQPYSYYQLQVGVWEDNGTFVPVALINNSTTGIEYVECDFSSYTGDGKRIAFRNLNTNSVSDAFSYNYIDDITISRDCSIKSLPYSEDFEGYTTSTTAATGVEPKCWELVQEDVTMNAARMPQLYYKSDYAHSGSYSLRLYYLGIYAMPSLADTIHLNTLKLGMYVRQPYSYYQLQVGVWEDDGTFVPVDTIHNSTRNMEYVEVDFSGYPGSGHRIAFRNVLASGYSYNYSYNYIDDISLSRIPSKIAEVETGNGVVAPGDNSAADETEIGAPMGVEGFMEDLGKLAVYPNPTTGVVNVQWTMYNVQVETAEIQVLDAYGKLVNVVKVQPDETVQIDLSRFARGIYFVKAVADGNVLGVKKVVKS